MSDRFIGIDVGGTKIAVAALQAGELSESTLHHTELGSQEALVDQLVHVIEAARTPDTMAVGIGLPSLVEFATGRIRSSVNVPLKDLPLRELLSERAGLPVYVENDASCAALAEAFRDGHMAVPHLVMFTVGTGVGGGLVLNGRLFRGATGAAAEVGHTIVGLDLVAGAPEHSGVFPQDGSLERLASGTALDRLAEEAAKADPNSFLGRRLTRTGGVTGHDVVDGAREGDEASIRCLRILGERLGVGIANAITMFDPLEVVIGGGVSAAGEFLLGPARETAWKYAVPGAGAHVQHPARAPRPAGRRARGRPDRGAGVRRRDRPSDGGGGGGTMRIACSFDHAGFPLKQIVLEVVREAGHEPIDLGTNSTDPVDYPDTARAGADAIREGRAERAVVVCGSGAGVAVAGCKFPGIRATCAHDPYTGHQCVEHDDVNMLCLGARVIGPALASEVIRAFLAAEFTGEERHVRRLGKIQAIEDEFTQLMADSGDLALEYLPIAEHGLVGDLHTVALVGTTGHDRLVLLPGVRLAERVRLDPRRRRRRLLRDPPGRRGVDVAAAVLPRHQHPDHALLHRGRGRRGAGLHADRVGRHRLPPAPADAARHGRARRRHVGDRGAAAVRLRARRPRGRDAPARRAVPLAGADARARGRDRARAGRAAQARAPRRRRACDVRARRRRVADVRARARGRRPHRTAVLGAGDRQVVRRHRASTGAGGSPGRATAAAGARPCSARR